MSFLRAVFVLMLVLPAYTYASGFTALSGNGMYTEGYYMPSLLENNSFSVRKIKKESASEDTSVLPGHDVKLTSSVLAAIGGGVGFGGDGVGLNFSVDYGEFLAKKVSYYWRGADAASETFTKKYEASRISRISSTTLTVSVCYERFTSPS
ncbi:hypothetical protein, partial [Anaplasma bovis]|uniref:hypothetical protein n=1 Tax=Anaplasma bovis TaxID=186733 RepID=UPI002FEF5A98